MKASLGYLLTTISLHLQAFILSAMPPKAVEAVNVGANNPEDFETKNVHAIYDAIASHFSSTRYKVRIAPNTMSRG
jgi:hypothetical protein